MAFKDYIDKSTGAVEGFSRGAVSKTKKIVEKTKIKNKISSEKRAIDGAYVTIGKLSYEAHKNGTTVDLDEHYATIDDHFNQIENLKAQLIAIDGELTCPKCGHSILSTDKFCPNCGNPNPGYVDSSVNSEEAKPAEKAEKAETTETNE